MRSRKLPRVCSGADDLSPKPFKVRSLETRVENLIGTRKMLRKEVCHETYIGGKGGYSHKPHRFEYFFNN